MLILSKVKNKSNMLICNTDMPFLYTCAHSHQQLADATVIDSRERMTTIPPEKHAQYCSLGSRPWMAVSPVRIAILNPNDATVNHGREPEKQKFTELALWADTFSVVLLWRP